MPIYTTRIISTILTFILTIISIYSPKPQAEIEIDTPVIANTILPKAKSEVVSILQSDESISMHLKHAADLYSQTRGDIKFSVRTVPGRSEYITALNAQAAAGNSADIFHIFGYNDITANQPEDLSDLSWLHDTLPGTLDAVSLGQSLYGVPYAVNSFGLIINNDIFEAAGIYTIDTSSNESLEEVFAKLHEKIGSGELSEDFPNLEAVTEFAANDKNWLGSITANLLLAGEFDSMQKIQTTKYINLEPANHAKQFLRIMALYSSCSKWSQLNDVTQARQVEDGIASERVAVILQNTEIYKRICNANPELKNSLRLIPIPMPKREENLSDSSVIFTGVNAYWAVNSSSDKEKKNSAKKFLTWLYCSEDGTKIMAEKFGILSPYQKTATDTDIHMHRQLLRQIDAGMTMPQLQNELSPQWLNQTAINMQNYLSLDIGWENLLQNLKEDWYANS